ncbi:MAG: DNA polymerase IV [Candidatus Marinimicrobia bacterium]|nr:DNA polymerase IV [Candidatus Neomarinimicrobiota bacterium]|tara:strand:+ start:1298 stop:2383 length:1086 start_codon:yes stop_codon:yes gene_type:complete
MEKIVRKIIHIDMDAFYASVEQLDDPSLRGKPVAVGGSKKRGVVAAASYEARGFGIRSAMPSVLAKKKCSDLIFVRPRFNRYKEISKKIRDIFYDYTDLVEPLSLDEAFLDVTINKKKITLAEKIAFEIRQRIRDSIGLSSSAGISINKFLAKIATEINKPDGQKTIHPSNVDSFIEKLPIEKFFGIGEVTAKKMNEMGIHHGKDLRALSQEYLRKKFGKQGIHYYKIVRSIQDSPVNPNRIRKSVGAERTFAYDIDSEAFILGKLNEIADELERRLINSDNKGKTVTVKIKYSDFTRQTRSKSVDHYLQSKENIFPVIEELIYQKKIEKPVRLLGISVTNLYRSERDLEKNYSMQLKFEF